MYGYIWLIFLWRLLSDLYEHVRDEVKRKCDVQGGFIHPGDVIWYQTRL